MNARERIAQARIDRRGYKRDAFPNEWSTAVRAFLRRARREMHRANGVHKLFAEIVGYMAAGVRVTDARALSTIAEQIGIRDRRHVRRCMGWLVRHGWIVRVHHQGERFAGQRGWTTNVYLAPGLLPYVGMMPDTFRVAALARLRALRAALDESPELVTLLGPAPVENPAGQVNSPPDNRVDPPYMGSDTSPLHASRSCTGSLVSPSYPPQASMRCGEPAPVTGEEGAGAPIPPIAEPLPCGEAPRARQAPTARASGDGPEPVGAVAPSEAQPGTGEGRPPTLRELRDRYYATGRYSSIGAATRAAAGALRTFARRRHRQGGKLDPGRRPRWRGVARELKRMGRERQAAGEPVDTGDPWPEGDA